MSGGGEQAVATVEQCLALFSHKRDLDGLLQYVPDSVLDGVMDRAKAKAAGRSNQNVACNSADSTAATEEKEEEGQREVLPVSFKDVLEHGAKDGFNLDAFAVRLLVLNTPRETQVLSSLVLGSRFLQRCRVVGQGGEEAVLTFELSLQEALEPRYRSVSVVPKWFLQGVSGEPGFTEEPTGPDPRLSPEVVVRAQLEALRVANASRVFAFASPGSRAATGPLERFAGMLSSPLFAPMLGHSSSEVLKTMQLSATRCMVMVGVESIIMDTDGVTPKNYVYVWVLSQQRDGPEEGCYMTEAVNPITTYLSL